MDGNVEIAAVILAAGKGRRMNAGVNKVWLPLCGQSILERTLAVFRAAGCFKAIVLVADPAELPDFETFLAGQPDSGSLSLVAGGEERQHSVQNALHFLQTWPGWSASRRLVAIHDAARPLLTVDLLNKGIEAALRYRAVGLAVPVKDTVKRADADQMVLDTPVRAGLWAMQTPQIFDFDLIADCHRKAVESGLLFTDDCSVAEYAGYPVKLVMSSYENIKITTPEDLRIAEALLNQGEN